jgi:hypothetical protein
MASTTFTARIAAGLTGTLVLTGLSLAVGAPTASADVQRGVGYETTPAQPYQGNPDAADWVGSYLVGGTQVWCVQFAYKAPDSDEQYQPGEALKTKWGTDLPPDVAADISYLLLRYAGTTNADEGAALAHLLHTWTSGPQSPDQLDPSNDFRHIAYDENFHFTKLPAGAQEAVGTLKSDATANHGPWTATVTAPTRPQVIGTADTWTTQVLGASGMGVGKVPVSVTITDGTLGDGKSEISVPTPDDGSPISLQVTPTGPNPAVAISLKAPAAVPVVQQALDADTQKIVSTGGEDTLTATAAATATPAPTPTVPQTIPAGEPVVAEAASGPSTTSVAAIVGLAALGTLLLASSLATRRRHRGEHQ